MYSRLISTHQKIDKLAYAILKEYCGNTSVLNLKDILHYEGSKGPDAPRLYATESSTPWHYYDPSGTVPQLPFLDILKDHYTELIKQLKLRDVHQSCFEAAWLAHALVDGLTPPHHFPVEAELEALHGASVDQREKISSHLLVKGPSKIQSFSRSWRLTGPKGMLTQHTYFEANAGLAAVRIRAQDIAVNDDLLKRLSPDALIEIFEKYAHEVDSLDLFKRFVKRGWSLKLTRLTRKELIPKMVKLVLIAWYGALLEAGVIQSGEES